jgi:hypothetical protein
MACSSSTGWVGFQNISTAADGFLLTRSSSALGHRRGAAAVGYGLFEFNWLGRFSKASAK